MGYLPKADRPKRRSVPGRNKDFYNTKAWKDAREHHLVIEPLCRECYKRAKLTEGTQVDHIIPIVLFAGSPLDDSNLQTLCNPCHGIKSAKENNL